MATLKDNRQIKKISLKDYEGSEVTLYTSLLVGDLIDFNENMSSIKQALYLFPKLIKEWNFTDEEGKPMPINEASIKMLSATAIAEIADMIEMNGFEAKKD